MGRQPKVLTVAQSAPPDYGCAKWRRSMQMGTRNKCFQPTLLRWRSTWRLKRRPLGG